MGRSLVLLFVLIADLLCVTSARAERELIVPFEEGGHLVLDQLSGLRLSSGAGMSYGGPAGVSFRSTKVDGAGETSTTTLWLAPSFDVFVTDHVSLGALLEVTHSWGSIEQAGQHLELPGTTSTTLLPRIGFYVPLGLGDRVGLWPRASVGYTSVASVSYAAAGSVPVRDTFHALMLDLDVAVVYRFGETFFMRAGPAVGATLGGQGSEESGSGTAGGSGTVWEVSGVLGLGMNLEL
jgi:hypothetical protein